MAEKSIKEMNVFELREYLRRLTEERDELDAMRPRDEGSEEFEDWADEHEWLEDEIDDVLDRLDEIAQN